MLLDEIWEHSCHSTLSSARSLTFFFSSSFSLCTRLRSIWSWSGQLWRPILQIPPKVSFRALLQYLDEVISGLCHNVFGLMNELSCQWCVSCVSTFKLFSWRHAINVRSLNNNCFLSGIFQLTDQLIHPAKSPKTPSLHYIFPDMTPSPLDE